MAKTCVLSRRALNRATLARQMLLAREKVSALRAVERLVGLQAQVPRPPFVGLWSRLDGFAREDLLKPIRARKVVRATLMRSTIHYFSAKDYVAMRAALQPALNRSAGQGLVSRLRGVDLAELVAAAHEIFAEEPCTFAALRKELLRRYPRSDERAMGYLARLHVPLVMVPDEGDWGYSANADFTIAAEWLGRPIESEVTPHKLVERYLAAFGPASAADMQAWSGLTKIKPVLDSMRPKLALFQDEHKRELFDLPRAPRPGEDVEAPVRFIPEYDNLLLGHADRSRVIAHEHRPMLVTPNLQVLGTFLVDGFAAGTWRVERAKGGAILVMKPFRPLSSTVRRELSSEGERLLRFVDPEARTVACRFELA